MARCTLDFSHPIFRKFLQKNEGNQALHDALSDVKRKVEEEHTSCNRVVQQFFGNKKFTHLHNKLWRYDWAPDGASAAGRKGWRMMTVVPDPDHEPYHLIAGAVYAKNAKDYMSLQELAALYASIVDFKEPPPETPEHFVRVPNGDGATRSMCRECLIWAAVSLQEADLDQPEQKHIAECPALVPAKG